MIASLCHLGSDVVHLKHFLQEASFFTYNFLNFDSGQRRFPLFWFLYISFLCFLLDFMSCNPNCVVYLITNSESLYKSPTFLSLPLKKLCKSTAMKTLKLFSYAHPCVSFYDMLSHVYVHVTIITLRVHFGLLWSLLLWRGHYLIS